MNLTAHPAADLFPLMTGAAFESFKADVAERGLLEPIWLYQGQILDGRNRYRACTELGIEPTFREYTGETPISFVWSLNGERRHLTESQRGAIARKMLPELREEARRRQEATRATPGHKVGIQRDTPYDESEKGRATEKAAERVGVSNATVNRVEYVAKRDPELLQQIEAGEITATEAVRVLKERDAEPSEAKKSRGDRAEQIRALAGEGYRSSQIASELGLRAEYVRKIAREEGITLPDAQLGRARHIDSNRIVEQTVIALSGLSAGLSNLEASDLDASQIPGWLSSLDESMPRLKKLHSQLRKMANGD